jgi:RNA polymerase sporulation-specific sigma factor
MLSRLTNEELVKLYSINNRKRNDVFAELVNRHKRIIRAKTAKWMPSLCDFADEMYQEALIALFKALRAYDESRGASFSTFATLCVGCALSSFARNERRLARREAGRVSIEAEGLEVADRCLASSPERVCALQETLDEIQRVVDKTMTDLERSLLYDALSGLTYKQIAARRGLGVKTVDNALSRARKKLIIRVKPHAA